MEDGIQWNSEKKRFSEIVGRSCLGSDPWFEWRWQFLLLLDGRCWRNATWMPDVGQTWEAEGEVHSLCHWCGFWLFENSLYQYMSWHILIAIVSQYMHIFFVASAQKGKFLDCLFFRAFEFSEICENQIYKNVKLEILQGVITVPQTPPVALWTKVIVRLHEDHFAHWASEHFRSVLSSARSTSSIKIW